MADRYQNRPFPTQEDYDRNFDRGGDPRAPARTETDPLAELARLIGQTDPFGAEKPPHPLQSRANVRAQYQPAAAEEESSSAGPPPWMQRARQEAPQQQAPEEPEYQPSPVHPLHRYAAQQAAPVQDYQEAPQLADSEPQPDPSRYDDALYGQIASGEQEYQRDPAYPDDPYAYQSSYDEEEPEPRKRSSGLITVAAVLALAVVGTGAALAYRTYIGTPRSGEPPIIKADNSPTKVVPAPTDGGAVKTPDRMLPGDGGERIVSREETPVDVNAKSGPRVVFPPLNQNGNPPPVASVAPAMPPAATSANGTMPNNEPRKIRTLSVKGDPAENGGVPVPAAGAKQASAARTAAAPAAAAPRNPSSANASANAPLSLSPQGGQPSDPAPSRVAAINPAQAAPVQAAPAGGGYVVQVSSQKNETEARASYRALQSKFPGVLGSHASLVKRVDLGDKGVYYRAFAGPFGSADEAVQLCNSLKSAGGQCFVQRN